MRKRLNSIVLVVGLFIGILVAGVHYFQFVSSMIYEESTSHLLEIYDQASQSLCNLVGRNWRNMHLWIPYLRDIKDEEMVEAYIQEIQKEIGFSEFFFLSSAGTYRTVDGKEGYLDLKEDLPKLMLEGTDIVTNVVLPGEPEQMLFAVPSDTGTYQGFGYEAIAISFGNSDFIKTLEISAFDGKADNYIIYADGRVLIDNTTDQERSVYNILGMLENRSDMDEEQFDRIHKAMKNGESGVTVLRMEEENYYLIYEAVEFEDWLLFGLVPTRVVNASMGRIQTATMMVVIGIAASLAAALLFFLIQKSRQRLEEKETEILYREELFGVLSNNVDDIFIMLDADGYKAGYISPNIEKIVGISLKEARSDIRIMNQLIGERDQVRILDEMRAMTPGQRREWEREYIHQKNGEWLWFHVLVLCTEIRGSVKYIVALSDRTKERQVHQTLENALEVAKSANEAKSNFLANMSHDIRTPMNAIIGFATLLVRDAGIPEKVLEYARKISFSSQHLLGLINDILDMSKIESGKTTLNITEFDIAEAMEEIYTIVMPQVRAKRQKLELSTKGKFPDRVLGDKTRLNQILLNLLSNAMKYTQEGGKICFTVEGIKGNVRKHAHLRFVVSDNGYGMSQKYLETIFEPFSRENTDRTQEIQGTGLGMAITKNIVDLMGGTISVQSALEQGSTFTVELELPVVDDTVNGNFWVNHRITRLLVADDEEEICTNIQTLMADTGVQVSYALSGEQALKMVTWACDHQEEFHVIILDWKMPEMDGVETARRIRAKVGRNVPILVLTAYDFSSIEKEAKEAGVDLFLQKPFFVSNFQRQIASYFHEDTLMAEEIPDQEENYSMRGLHVLVAEDNEINAEILEELLDMEGVTCEIRSNGQEVLDRFLASKSGEFDLIFLDIQMPVMDGYQAARKIRASSHPDAADIPIIAMTANAFEEDVRKSLKAGMNAHTDKPVDMKKLKATVAEVMRDRRKKAMA